MASFFDDPEAIAEAFRVAEWIAHNGTDEEKSGKYLPEGFTTPIPEEVRDGRWPGTTRLVESGFNVWPKPPSQVSKVSARYRRAPAANSD